MLMSHYVNKRITLLSYLIENSILSFIMTLFPWIVFLTDCFFSLSVQASVTSSTETTKSKTVIKMEKEKIYLYLNQFTTKVDMSFKSFLLSFFSYVSCHLFHSVVALSFIGSYYGSNESYGYGERSRGCPDGWKRPPL